ncbi:MAG: type II secretion system protein [Acidobacteria bacterium]|nr:type II secretion system protein [Acidobacteriota bacterium]
MKEPEALPTNGFTLAELLVIVALVAVLAAIILPNVLRSQISANEASAVGSIASINRAEVSYQTANPTIGFASSLESLGPIGKDSECHVPSPAHACLIEAALAQAGAARQARSGYWFRVSPGERNAQGAVSAYVAGAAAAEYKQTGVRDFCSEEDGVIRFRDPGGSSRPAANSAECAAMSILQ